VRVAPHDVDECHRWVSVKDARRRTVGRTKVYVLLVKDRHLGMPLIAGFKREPFRGYGLTSFRPGILSVRFVDYGANEVKSNRPKRTPE